MSRQEKNDRRIERAELLCAIFMAATPYFLSRKYHNMSINDCDDEYAKKLSRGMNEIFGADSKPKDFKDMHKGAAVKSIEHYKEYQDTLKAIKRGNKANTDVLKRLIKKIYHCRKNTPVTSLHYMVNLYLDVSCLFLEYMRGNVRKDQLEMFFSSSGKTYNSSFLRRVCIDIESMYKKIENEIK